MKTFLILFATIFCSTYNYSQKTEVVDSVSIKKANQQENTPIIKNKEYPFKIYKVYNDHWNISQDMYNDIQAKVPGVSITSNRGINSVPTIRMRGDDNTIVIVDGIRYDASILSSLNPSDIESITVAPSLAAANYLRNN